MSEKIDQQIDMEIAKKHIALLESVKLNMEQTLFRIAALASPSSEHAIQLSANDAFQMVKSLKQRLVEVCTERDELLTRCAGVEAQLRGIKSKATQAEQSFRDY